jgi:hypothetical protein
LTYVNQPGSSPVSGWVGDWVGAAAVGDPVADGSVTVASDRSGSPGETSLSVQPLKAMTVTMRRTVDRIDSLIPRPSLL